MDHIMEARTAIGTGNWQQAHKATTTYVNVNVSGGAHALQLDLITSDTDGTGAGGRTVTEESIKEETTSIRMPSGTYFINAMIRSNPNGKEVTITTEANDPG
jgi:hypothetical protein